MKRTLDSQDLAKLLDCDRMKLYMRSPEIARILLRCEFEFTDSAEIKLACNDCRRIFLSSAKYPSLSQEKRLAVLAHEAWHIALMHIFRRGDRDAKRFAFAADAEVHFRMKGHFCEPYPANYKPQWEDWSAEEIYDNLTKHATPQSDFWFPGIEPEKNQDKQSSPDSELPPTESSDSGEPQDNQHTSVQTTEDMNDGKKDEHQNDQFVPSAETPQDEPQNNQPDSSGEPVTDNSTSPSKLFISPHLEEDAEGFSTAAAQILYGGANGCGSLPDSILFQVQSLQKPQVKWKTLLRQYVQECRGSGYKWLPPNRRFIAQGVYLPGRRGQKFQGVVALDTSGSTQQFLPQFMSELLGLLKTFRKFDLTVIECDAKIQQVWKVSDTKPMPDLSKHEFKGMGGTNFTPVFQYVQSNIPCPNVLIFFTDGDGPCCSCRPPYPVLWMLTENGQAPVDWGYQIQYDKG